MIDFEKLGEDLGIESPAASRRGQRMSFGISARRLPMPNTPNLAAILSAATEHSAKRTSTTNPSRRR